MAELQCIRIRMSGGVGGVCAPSDWTFAWREGALRAKRCSKATLELKTDQNLRFGLKLPFSPG
jgi:hypothetical protein